MNWNYIAPEEVGNYICDMGGLGISLAYWNGNNWIEIWGNKVVKKTIYGWINIPNHLDRNKRIHKKI